MTTTVLRGSDGDAIVVDDTYFPVFVSTWFGRASEPSVRAYYEHLGRAIERALAERTLLVNVVDSGPAEVPSADVRRLISELTSEWEKRGATPTNVRALVVIESAAIRGVLNVLGWLHPGGMRSENVASLAVATERALSALAAAGHPAPRGLGPSTLSRPARPR